MSKAIHTTRRLATGGLGIARTAMVSICGCALVAAGPVLPL